MFLKIQNYDEKPYFKDYSINSIVRFIRGAFLGGEYKGEKIDPLIDDEEYQDLYNSKRVERMQSALLSSGVYVNWDDNETRFIIEQHNLGEHRKNIHRRYNENEEFTPRTSSSISSHLDHLLKSKIIMDKRINWDGEIGLTVLYLLDEYGKVGDYKKLNAKCLDDYFFDGENKITRHNLHNFYKRNKINSNQ